MLKQLKQRLEHRSYVKRLQRYRLQLSLIGGQLNNLKLAPKLLSELWCHIQVSDITTFTPQQRISVMLDLGHASLIELVEFIAEFNTLMAGEHDSALEQLCVEHFTEIRPRVLDHYLSDSRHMDVDVYGLLTLLKGHLLSHLHILEGFDNQYYQRLATRFYQDVYRLTTQLVETVTGKEIPTIDQPS